MDTVVGCVWDTALACFDRFEGLVDCFRGMYSRMSLEVQMIWELTLRKGSRRAKDQAVQSGGPRREGKAFI